MFYAKHTAYDSKYVDDSFVTDCAALCETLVDDFTYQIADYNVKNKEVDTISLKRQSIAKLAAVRTRFKLLQRVIDL